MSTENKALIAKTVDFVRETLKNAEGGHDWWHIYRVWNNAKLIAQTETADLLTVELAALLHDIADSKFNNGDEEMGPVMAANFLRSIDADEEMVAHVEQIIRHISFKTEFDNTAFNSVELDIVKDADRLDAIGAIGIARTFNYGGFKGREIFNPEIKPKTGMTKAEYKNSTAPSINHFYEKLLLLKDKMNTKTGKALAKQRHDFMLSYLYQFFIECGDFTGY
jgi:uncharacterized protein